MTDEELWDEAMRLAEEMGLPEFPPDEEGTPAVWLADDLDKTVRQLPDDN